MNMNERDDNKVLCLYHFFVSLLFLLLLLILSFFFFFYFFSSVRFCSTTVAPNLHLPVLIGSLCLVCGEYLFKNSYNANLSRAPLNTQHKQLPARIYFRLVVAVEKKIESKQHSVFKKTFFSPENVQCEWGFSRGLC